MRVFRYKYIYIYVYKYNYTHTTYCFREKETRIVYIRINIHNINIAYSMESFHSSRLTKDEKGSLLSIFDANPSPPGRPWRCNQIKSKSDQQLDF